MPTAYLNIGSNQGDRLALIERAVALIINAFPQASLRLSQAIETEPWGFESPHPFINIGAALDFDTLPEPLVLLKTCNDIERSISPLSHRNPDGSYRDRLIDIDIIEMDGVEMDTPALTLPHPRAHLREFVMIPMRELKQQK